MSVSPRKLHPRRVERRPALVIVNDLDVVSIAIAPTEAQPPLVIDANAVLTLTVSLQGFEPIPWWAIHVVQDDGAVQLP